ncbi:hypothetical protein U9M48_037553 [Paspalum notatum var. saurae]|uniref:KIB1-4 beta-propeller domain-containing protein n=1 Tax=Paspalum notatum var. saurae TaxID=547442 RepID=A0AAQ3X9E8_PASNO
MGRMANRRRPSPAEAAGCPIPIPPKRRRRAEATPTTSSPWSSMHEDLVSRIAERVLAAGDVLDYVRFRAVCPQWRSCTVDPRGRGVADPRFHPRRWTMLPEGHGLHPGHAKLRGQVRFFNRYTGAFVRVRIPELKDHFILDSPDGLLLLERDADTAVRLLHPFTGDICELPPLTSLIPQLDRLTDNRPRHQGDKHRVQSFRRVAAAVSVSPAAVTVLLALEHICRFAHASTGDRAWTLTTWSTSRVARTLPFQGSLYLACWGSEETSILRLDPPALLQQDEDEDDDDDGPQLHTIAQWPSKRMRLPQLVECDSEILVVCSTDHDRSHLVVLRLADLLLLGQGGQRAVPLPSIGDYCLFFGMRSMAVSAKGLPSVAANSIILCDSIKDRLMQFNLGDATLSLACDGDIVRTPPPSPHSIVHHLVTCCYRYFWNKGLIYCSRTKPNWGTKNRWRLGA